MILFVKATSFVALILLIPPAIEAVVRGCRNLYRR